MSSHVIRRLTARQRRAARCYDCGCRQGELHELWCSCEHCPECGGQLVTCACDNKGPPPPDERRVPFVFWPNICALCGLLDPDFFRVSDPVWEHYVERRERDKLVCSDCWRWLINTIDGGTFKRRFSDEGCPVPESPMPRHHPDHEGNTNSTSHRRNVPTVLVIHHAPTGNDTPQATQHSVPLDSPPFAGALSAVADEGAGALLMLIGSCAQRLPSRSDGINVWNDATKAWRVFGVDHLDVLVAQALEHLLGVLQDSAMALTCVLCSRAFVKRRMPNCYAILHADSADATRTITGAICRTCFRPFLNKRYVDLNDVRDAIWALYRERGGPDACRLSVPRLRVPPPAPPRPRSIPPTKTPRADELYTIHLKSDGSPCRATVPEMTAATVMKAVLWHADELDRLDSDAEDARIFLDAVQDGSVDVRTDAMAARARKHAIAELQAVGKARGKAERLWQLVTTAMPEWTPPPKGDVPLNEALQQFWPYPVSSKSH
jgi:hypothetical protein